VWRQTQFFWRVGYWMDHRPGWVWCPAHYVRTPGGCLFVNGYWDLPLHERGLLFCPVRVPRTVLATRWTYSPSFVVNTDFLFGAMFVRPKARCYYFGDYFDDRYQKRGYVAWTDYRVGRAALDQNFAYYRQTFREREGWEESLRGLYAARRSGDIARPPRTLTQQVQAVKNVTVNKVENNVVSQNINITNVQNVTVIKPVKEVKELQVTALANLGKGPPPKEAKPLKVVKLQEVQKEQRDREKERAQQLRQAAQQRQKVEVNLHANGGVAQKAKDDQPPPRPQDRPDPKPQDRRRN
jgi:hypothetical protein